MNKRHTFTIAFLILFFLSGCGGGDDSPPESTDAVWDESNWDEKNWQ